MLLAVLLAGAIVAGSHPVVIAVGASAALHPGGFLAAAAVWAVVHRRRSAAAVRAQPGDEVAFLHALASELRSGSSLRSAVDAAAAGAPRLPLQQAARLATAGLPASQVAGAVAAALPVNGRLVGAALALTAATGARAADVFEALALRAAEAGELERERRAGTAQARLSALVVGLAPFGFAIVMLVGGRGSVLIEAGPVGIIVLAVGFGLQLAGLGIVWWMLQGAAR
jgi:tight adherence protein B